MWFIISLIFFLHPHVKSSPASDLIRTQNQISQTYQKMNELDQSITNIQAQAITRKNEILQANQKLNDMDQALDKLNKKIEQQQNKIQDASRKLYILSFTDDEFAQVYFSYYLKSIMHQHAKIKKLRQQLKTAHQDQHQKANQLSTKKKEYESTLIGMKEQRSELSTQIVKLQKALTSTVKKSSLNTSKAEEFQPTNLATLKHKLAWPATGVIKQHFAQAILNSKLKSDAIIITFPSKTNIHAIHPGVVVHNQWLPAYGYLVIIDHGFGYHSLYGHLDQVQVRKDQVVHANDIIGQTNPAGENANNQLYFALKHHLKPLDPEQWLK